MASLEDFRNALINNASNAGLAKDKLFEYESSRWVCLGWKSYGGMQLIEYVREYGDYQVGIDHTSISFSEDENVNRMMKSYWYDTMGYQRVIVTHLEATGMIVEKVDNALSMKYPHEAISLKTLREWQKKQRIDLESVPNQLIPFWIFERVNDFHLTPKARHDVDLQKLVDAAKIGSWREKDGGVIKVTLN